MVWGAQGEVSEVEVRCFGLKCVTGGSLEGALLGC